MKFEYKLFRSNRDNRMSEELMNELGQQGWELVSVTVADQDPMFSTISNLFVFKRRCN